MVIFRVLVPRGFRRKKMYQGRDSVWWRTILFKMYHMNHDMYAYLFYVQSQHHSKDSNRTLTTLFAIPISSQPLISSSSSLEYEVPNIPIIPSSSYSRWTGDRLHGSVQVWHPQLACYPTFHLGEQQTADKRDLLGIWYLPVQCGGFNFPHVLRYS